MPTATSLRTGESQYCREEAYRFFLDQLPCLHTTHGLVRAAIAISMHAMDDVDPRRVEQRLETLSVRVRERSPSRTAPALLANLHAVLFDEEGFSGNLDRYYNALNTYLPAVINSRLGLPSTLALIYKAVGEWSGLEVEGINAPGHFLVRVRCHERWMIVDPFFGGQVLTREEAFLRLEQVHDRKLPRCEEYLAIASHEQWITRILGNLRQLFSTEGRRDDLAAMTELSMALRLVTRS